MIEFVSGMDMLILDCGCICTMTDIGSSKFDFTPLCNKHQNPSKLELEEFACMIIERSIHINPDMRDSALGQLRTVAP